MKKIYLALPYSGVEKESYELANKITIELLKQGYNVFSPITHSHPLSSELPGNWEFWEKIDYQFIDWCDMIVVLTEVNKKHYTSSVGVMAEIKYAINKKIIKYLDPSKKFKLTNTNIVYYE